MQASYSFKDSFMTCELAQVNASQVLGLSEPLRKGPALEGGVLGSSASQLLRRQKEMLLAGSGCRQASLNPQRAPTLLQWDRSCGPSLPVQTSCPTPSPAPFCKTLASTFISWHLICSAPEPSGCTHLSPKWSLKPF